MAVLGRLLVSSAERLDLPDLLSIDSYGAGDWKYFIQGLIGPSKPYILKGFDVIDPQNAIGTQSCSIRVADSVVLYPGSTAGPFYHGLSEGNENALPLVPELRKNAVNYVYLTFSTFNTSVDTRAFWDPDKDGGNGGEFTQDVNTESVLKVEINVSTGSFPANTIPVAKVTVGAVVITAIQDARDLMYRLGTGGISPDPNSTYNFRSLPTSQYQRNEPPTIMSNPSDPNPFQGADKNILSLKEWMDVVMTKLKELGGTTYWYQDASTFSIASIFADALTTTYKSKGKYLHSSATAGDLTWSEDILIKQTASPKDTIIRDGSIVMANEQVAYLPLVRNQSINTFDEPVAWTNGQPYVNTIGGSIGKFANLTKGDWVKKISDDSTYFLRVEEFYDAVNMGGSVTTAANARSIRLNSNYLGSTAQERARYDQGVYQASDVVVSDRNNPAIGTTGGNFLWLALRSDTIENISAIQSFAVSGTVTVADGSRVEVSATSHGLLDGDRITVSAPAAQAGTYTVEVEDANTFFFMSSNTTTGAFTGHYGLLTTAARTNGYGLQLESSTHGFESGETIVVAGTTNFNDSYVINERSSTQVQFPISAAFGAESTGTATLARIDVRTETGITKVVQGETIDIGEGDSDNIQRFIGMHSLAETHPLYFVPGGYGAINGMHSYNASETDNLTARASKLTAMMADKAQDKTVKYLSDANTAINTQNGAAQELTFQPAASSLTILQPGGAGNATIALPDTAPGISLLTNQSAYVVIDRNASSTPSIVVANNSSIPIAENVFVIASRLGGQSVFLWNGSQVIGSAPLVPGGSALVKVKYYDPVATTLPTGNPVVEDGSNVQAGDLVLFSALSSNNNRIYKALGSGTNITGWSTEFAFNGLQTPTDGDTVIVTDGTGFADQIGKFTGTTWVFNNYVRYFNGTDYWEQSALITSTLTDNTTGNVFTVNYAGSEYQVIDYSISRGLTRETGTIHVVTDGSTVNVTTTGAYLGISGVTFSGDISGGTTLRIRYTTTNTGSNATMKYMVRRWSNSAGGPAGVPSYTGVSGSGGAAAGGLGQIQFSDGTNLAANANFKIDTTALALNLNGLYQTILNGPVTVTDNVVVPTALFTLTAADHTHAVIEYSCERNGESRTGRFLISHNGSVVGFSDDYVETNPLGVTFTADISGANLRILFVSTNTGFNGTLKFALRRWI